MEDNPFPSLEILGLGYNGLTIESVSVLAYLPRLSQLDLTCNELSTLPDTDGFANLEKLSLRRNLFRDDAVIEQLARLPKLQVIDLSENGFVTIPTSLMDLDGSSSAPFEALRFLDLGYNFFESQDSCLLYTSPSPRD